MTSGIRSLVRPTRRSSSFSPSRARVVVAFVVALVLQVFVETAQAAASEGRAGAAADSTARFAVGAYAGLTDPDRHRGLLAELRIPIAARTELGFGVSAGEDIVDGDRVTDATIVAPFVAGLIALPFVPAIGTEYEWLALFAVVPMLPTLFVDHRFAGPLGAGLGLHGQYLQFEESGQVALRLAPGPRLGLTLGRVETRVVGGFPLLLGGSDRDPGGWTTRIQITWR